MNRNLENIIWESKVSTLDWKLSALYLNELRFWQLNINQSGLGKKFGAWDISFRNQIYQTQEDIDRLWLLLLQNIRDSVFYLEIEVCIRHNQGKRIFEWI